MPSLSGRNQAGVDRLGKSNPVFFETGLKGIVSRIRDRRFVAVDRARGTPSRLRRREIRACAVTRFSGPEEQFLLPGGRVTRDALAGIRRMPQDAARDCAAIIERDR